jgi:hypothetical protein
VIRSRVSSRPALSIGIPAAQREELRASDRMTPVDDDALRKVEQVQYRALGA